MEPKESEFTKKINRWLQRTNNNVAQMKFDILSKAMGTDETAKKQFNLFFYAGFLCLFGVGYLLQSRVIMLVTGMILGTSFVGWVYANAKGYFGR
tara:strand:+ start:135 stop:419 length:285 start_codon:yes stop_codon:yes gene_type:complete